MADVECYVCGKIGHFAKKCTDRKGRKTQQGKDKSTNMIMSDAATGYGNTYTILTACQPTEWWIDTGANIHVCANISLFSSY